MFTTRKSTIAVNVGGIGIGGDNPIRIQSMTNTLTANVEATAVQIADLANAGSELVRITVNDDEAAQAVPHIVARLKDMGIFVPIVGDFHYNGHLLLTQYPDMAKALAKYRINPGNVGTGERHDANFKAIVECAVRYNKPVRIGINGGSLDKELLSIRMEDNAKLSHPKDANTVFIETMVESALLSANKAQEYGLKENQIIISVKMSDVQDMVRAYLLLSERTNIPLHLGLTEAGIAPKGIVASSAALGILLAQGIGDTIRVSLTPEPDTPRTAEVEVCKALLQSMGLRQIQPLVISCPGCGRTDSVLFQVLAQKMNRYIAEHLPRWKQQYIGFEGMKIAIMGCIVNGIGEAEHADIGLFIPGNKEDPKLPVYVQGKPYATLKGERVFEEFIEILEKFLAEKTATYKA